VILITLDKSVAFLTDYDLYLFSEGAHYRTYDKLGAHPIEQDGRVGTHFAVWAPNAREVSVLGDFNGWQPGVHPMKLNGPSGVWDCFIPEVRPGAIYKYGITSALSPSLIQKADPFAFYSEVRPRTGSRVWDIGRHVWQDQDWMASRAGRHAMSAPISIYEVHAGSWRRVPEEGNRWLTYREMTPLLIDYVKGMGYTHIEFMPLSEHPFDGSWGYQTIGHFAPTSRFGNPDDLMWMIDQLHQNEIGVILDWVPAHFPRDAHGLNEFDGTHLYEHADPRQGFHPEWNTAIFNYGRREVINYLLSNALFWLDKYHIDGLRVDAVSSMLYLDYSRKAGEWIPNKYGGRENLEAIAFLRRFNEVVYKEYPDVMTIAEESTSWPMVSRPAHLGGLGFGFKWDMGWMHDTLDYFSKDPIHRKYYQQHLTFRMLYVGSENFMLPLSHDEVVYGKKAVLSKMPGDVWQQMANLRLLLGYQFTQPGKKLLFMGIDIGQWTEWNHDVSLDWHLLDFPTHQGLQRWVRDLNTFYRAQPALHAGDVGTDGLEWIDCSDSQNSVLAYLRKNPMTGEHVVVVCNFTPQTLFNYRIGVPQAGEWEEILNSDAPLYGGSGQGNFGGVPSFPITWHRHPQSINLTLPPLAAIAFKRKAD
jgi:1,4-alpha-glucan branching enzyme